MTTYSTEFDGYTNDAQPSDWTVRWVTTNSTFAVRAKAGTGGGKVLEHSSTADGRRLLSYDVIDADANRANVEILARVRQPSVGGSNLDQTRLHARASGSAASETGYGVSFSGATAGSIQLFKLVSGTSTNLGTVFTNFQWTASVWYYLRFRVNGTTLSAKIWREDEVEPADWGTTATDSAISAAGWVGVGNLESSGTNRDFDYVAIATNGDTAPLAYLTSTNIKTHQAALEVIAATVARGRVHQAALEVVEATVAGGRIHQAALEVIIGASVPGHIHQVVLEVVIAQSTAVTQQPRMIVLM